MGLAGIFLNFLDLSFVVRFGFLLLWVWLGLGMGKIGADLRLETKISEKWSEGKERERRD